MGRGEQKERKSRKAVGGMRRRESIGGDGEERGGHAGRQRARLAGGERLLREGSKEGTGDGAIENERGRERRRQTKGMENKKEEDREERLERGREDKD